MIPDIPTPSYWPDGARALLLKVVSLAHWAAIRTRSWAADSRLQRVRLTGQLDKAKNEVTLLNEELRIKDTRMAKVPARSRPYYPPTERMAILELKAARGWNMKQTADTFLVEPETIASWLRRLDEEGDSALVQLDSPVNKFPGFVRHVVSRMKVLCPRMGTKRISELLSRAGLAITSTTVARFLRSPTTSPDRPTHCPATTIESTARTVSARHPNHVWHVDLTVVPTRAGFWVPWMPFCLPQVWPFCWWVAVAVDHFSRRIMGFAVFKKQPSSLDVRSFLGRAMGRARARPRHLICDRGKQFDCGAFRKWAKRKK